MKELRDKYFSILEPKAIFLIGFLLSYPIALIAANSIPVRLPIEKLFWISMIVWLVLYLIKPIKSYISVILLMVQGLWFFSLAAILPGHLQDGIEAILPGGTKWANTIYYDFFGESYAHFIYYIRALLEEKTDLFNAKYYYIFIVFIIAAIMIIVMKLLEKRVNWKWFLITTGYFIIAWFIYVSSLKSYFSLYFIGLTVYRQFMVYENLVKDAKGLGERTRYYSYTSAIVIGTIMMVSILIISNIAMLMLPIDKVNDKIHAYVPSISSIRSDFRSLSSSKIFNFSSTMYSPNDNLLGGPITERDYSVIMRVKSDEGSLYLRGRAKNIYDGSQWTTDFDIYHNNVYSDELIINEHLEELVVYPETIVSRTLFSPYKYYSSSFNKDKIFGNEDSIVYRKARTNINLERYSVNYIKPEFIHLYDTLPNDLREHYLTVPSQGLVETRALTARLTTELNDPYEIMKTLERHLRDNYRYTLNTRAIDTEKDFVENFLFEEKQGYCTYFATSLAVMGRMAGVPTRYVEGFITSSILDYEGYYEVSANRAHAWVEAYIEGRGWIRFEATPAYLNGDEIVSEDVFDDTMESSDGILGEFDAERFREEEEGGFVVTETETVPVQDIILILLYVSLVGLVILIVYKKARRLTKDISDGTPDEKIKKRILYMLSMCKSLDEDINTTELPKHVIVRVSTEVLDLEVPDEINQMIDTSLYSNKVFELDEFERLNKFFIQFESAVKKKITPVGHFVQKVLMNSLYHKDYYQ
ncbi:MAG: transglutaminase domain-containing protein [Clostridiales bacterium]|nr:transglutaminase domain-containing protein [Clostridiales bacterium]